VAALDIITLAEAKATVNLDPTDVTHDAELARFISAVSSRIDDLCGPVVARSVTELHDGGDTTIRPRSTPVGAVTSLTEYVGTVPTVLTAESNVSKPAAGYLLDVEWVHNVKIIRRNGGNDARFPLGRKNVELVYSAGRAANTAAVPDVFRMAAALTVQHMWKPSAGMWAQASQFGDDVRSPVAPWLVPRAVTELLHDELRPAGVA
jgi:hypothetical protein